MNSKTNNEQRVIEMYENNFCAECERVVHYGLSTNNCFKQSPLNEKRCENFKPNKDKI